MVRLLLIAALLLASTAVSSQVEDGTSLAPAFQREVDRRLDVPLPEQARYAQLVEAALASAATPLATSQYLLVVDRNPNVQAVFVYWLDMQAAAERLHFIGASPASTGKRGRYDYFITPVGVFPHTLAFMDTRAKGTRNKQGIRAYGSKGMRVYDFGWVMGERGWGRGGLSQMRLLIHATDPVHIEPRLGVAMSKGCIRIPETLNTFIDRHGLLDADYEKALARGKRIKVLRADRMPTPWSGRYLVVVDSGSSVRPAWSPKPAAIIRKRKASAEQDDGC